METAQAAEPTIQTTVRIFPLMALHALRQNRLADVQIGCAYRAWLLLRAVAGSSGVARAGDVEKCLQVWGIPLRRWKRWIKCAIKLRYVIDKDRVYDGQPEIIYLPHKIAKVAYMMGMDDIGNRQVSMPISTLIAPDCAAAAWEGFLLTHNNKTISRQTLRDISGVPETTQRRYEAARGIHPQANYAVAKRPADQLTGIREFEHDHAFVIRLDGEVLIAYQIPNTYTVEELEILTLLHNGRSRKINAQLKTICGQMAVECVYVRRYHHNHKSCESTSRRIPQLDGKGVSYDKPEKLFEPRVCKRPYHVNFWNEVEVRDVTYR